MFLHVRLRYWIVTLGKFGAAQMLVQAVTAAAGILIVRYLDKGEYALFVIASTALNTVNQLAETGVSLGILNLGGPHWGDRHRLGQIVNTALKMRRLTTLFWGLGAAPIMFWMLRRNSASPAYAGLITATVLLALTTQFSFSIYRTVSLVRHHFGELQRIDLAAAAVRLLLVGGMVLFLLNAELAVVATVASGALQWWLARRYAWEGIDVTAAANAADRAILGARVRQLLPDATFYALQGQVWIVLTTLTGKKEHLAEIGALGRLAVLLTIVGSITGNVLAPAFTRSQSPFLLLRRYGQIVLANAVIGLTLTAVAAVYPQPLLWLLGTGYTHLKFELVLIAFSATLSLVSQAMWSLNAVRGWTEYLWVEIPVRILWQILLLCLLDISTVTGVLHFMILTALSPILVTGILALQGLHKMRLAEACAAAAR